MIMIVNKLRSAFRPTVSINKFTFLKGLNQNQLYSVNNKLKSKIVFVLGGIIINV